MKNFCSGLLVGTIVGAVTGMVVVAKNKNLSNMIKEKSEIASKKISNFANKIRKSFSENECDCKCNENQAYQESQVQANNGNNSNAQNFGGINSSNNSSF